MLSSVIIPRLLQDGAVATDIGGNKVVGQMTPILGGLLGAGDYVRYFFPPSSDEVYKMNGDRAIADADLGFTYNANEPDIENPVFDCPDGSDNPPLCDHWTLVDPPEFIDTPEADNIEAQSVAQESEDVIAVTGIPAFDAFALLLVLVLAGSGGVTFSSNFPHP